MMLPNANASFMAIVLVAAAIVLPSATTAQMVNVDGIEIFEDTIRFDDRGYAYFKVFGPLGDYDYAIHCQTGATFLKDYHGDVWKPVDRLTSAIERFVCRRR